MASRYRAVAALLIGSILIAGTVLVILRKVAFGGLIDLADVRTLWLPTYCYLGRSLASGHVPGWNPFTLSGAPFAADPQSGWMYLPAMALFTALPCDTAIRSMVVLLPILAGLGLWAFLWSEGLSWAAGVGGGVALAILVAGSAAAAALPLAGVTAWVVLMLAACSRAFRVRTWPVRLVWCGLTALAWGQVAGALLTDGLMVGTVALAIYVAVAIRRATREGALTGGESATLVGLLALCLPLLNLAYLLPRVAQAAQTNLGLGYAGIQRLYQTLDHRPVVPLAPGPAAGISWPLALAASPGGHLAAVGLGLSFAALGDRHRRGLAVGFAALAGLSYLLSLRMVADAVPAGWRSLSLVGLYVHSPQRWTVGFLIGICVLVALGIEAWREAHTVRRRMLMVAPGALLWGLGPPVMGASWSELRVFVGGAAGAVLLLALAARRPAALVLVPVLMAVEGALSPMVAEARHPFEPVADVPSLIQPLPDPIVVASTYVRPKPLALALRVADRGRYLTVGTPKTIQVAQRVAGGGFLNEALLFGLPSVDGYNSVQPLRYWAFDRVVEPGPMQYNLAVVGGRSPGVLNLLQVGLEVEPVGAPPPHDAGAAVVRQGSWVVYDRPARPPRASVLTAWRVVPSPDGLLNLPALGAVTAPSFDPAHEAIVETRPALPGPPPRGAAAQGVGSVARYRGLGPDAARVTVTTRAPSIVLIRDSYDPEWHATLDGRPVPLLRTDYLMQGVAVPPGRHTVDLRYDDPWIGEGLLGSGAAIALLLVATLGLLRRTRSRPFARPVPD